MARGILGEARLPRDVHIVPIAREVDRAVLPFLPRPGRPPILHAHKIHLIVPEDARARRASERVETLLRPLAEIERHGLEARKGSVGFSEVLYLVARLCQDELQAGNRVHLNLSSGSKLVAFAAGIAGMAHLRPGTGSIYHVRHEGLTFSEADFETHGQTRGMLDVEALEFLPIQLPAPAQLRILSYLRFQPSGQATYRDLLQFLGRISGGEFGPAPKSPTSGIRRWNNAATTRMVRKLLNPLERGDLVTLFAVGARKGVRLTPRGFLVSGLAGLDARSVRRPLAPASGRLGAHAEKD